MSEAHYGQTDLRDATFNATPGVGCIKTPVSCKNNLIIYMDLLEG